MDLHNLLMVSMALESTGVALPKGMIEGDSTRWSQRSRPLASFVGRL